MLDRLGLGHHISVASAAFAPGTSIPLRHAKHGENLSPPLSWPEVPDATVSVAVLCEDPDAPGTEPFVHWVLFGLSPATKSLPEGIPEGATAAGFGQGRNSYGNLRYDGPAPPPEHGVHHYHFQVFALDMSLTPHDATPLDRDGLARAMSGHVLAAGELVGTYER